VLAKFPAEVEADLAHYYDGLDLADMYRGLISVRRIAVLVLQLPRGANLWVSVGGAGAVTAEVDALWNVEHAILSVAHGQGGRKGPAPERRKYPPGLEEVQAKQAKAVSQAEAFRAKHHKK
jgi:hypothetical protein